MASKSRQVNSLTGVQILASGCYTPENVIANEALADLGYDADWIIQRTGSNPAVGQVKTRLAVTSHMKQLAVVWKTVRSVR